MLFRSNDTATTEIYTDYYTLSLHDALPISGGAETFILVMRKGERTRAARISKAISFVSDEDIINALAVLR